MATGSTRNWFVANGNHPGSVRNWLISIRNWLITTRNQFDGVRNLFSTARIQCSGIRNLFVTIRNQFDSIRNKQINKRIHDGAAHIVSFLNAFVKLHGGKNESGASFFILLLRLCTIHGTQKT
jgi:hypothetical protein